MRGTVQRGGFDPPPLCRRLAYRHVTRTRESRCDDCVPVTQRSRARS